jgi:sugar lactone lactonase YvrE
MTPNGFGFMEGQNKKAEPMKNKQAETKFKSTLCVARHLFSRVACLGALVLICSSAAAQNLFMSDGYSGIERDLGNIYKIAPDGGRSFFASELNGPLGLAFDSTGNLFVASFGGAILKFAPDRTQSTFAIGLNYPEGLTFDSAGNLFVTDGGKVYEFSPQGARTTFASGLGHGSGLAFDSAGNLFVVDTNTGNVYKYTPGGARSTFASGLSYPFDLAFDSAGSLFVTDWGSGSGGHISKFTPDGTRSTFAELGAPEGLAFDSAGNLFVVDADTEEIFKFTPAGVRSTFAKNVGLGLDLVAHLAFQPTQALTPPIVATPSVSPNGGKFRRRVMVTLTDVTPGTTIYYTLDGSDPTTTSISYQGAFVLTRSATVKAIAVDSSGDESGIAIARFRIKKRF